MLRLIDREKECELVDEALSQVNAGQGSHSVLLEFHGLAGIGKTWLLDENRRQAVNLGLASARIEYGNLGHIGRGIRFRFMEAIVNQLQGCGGPAPYAYREKAEAVQRRTGPLSPADDELHSLTDAFLAHLQDCLLQMTCGVLIIFDDTDRFPEDFFKWLNRDILAQLVGCRNLVIIFGGRKKLSPQLLVPEVRKYLVSHAVEAFDLEATTRQISSCPNGDCYAPHAQELHSRLTCGHPKSIEAVVSFLNSSPAGDFGRRHLAELAVQLREEVIQKYIFDQMPGHLRPVLQLVAYSRRFEVSLLTGLLGAYAERAGLEANSSPDVIGLIANLMARTDVVTYESGEGAYKLDRLLAKLIQATDLLTSPSAYAEIHAFLADWHLELPLAKNSSDVRNLGDGLYHLSRRQVGLLQGTQLTEAEAIQQIVQRLESELKQRYDAASEQAYIRANELRDHFKSDADLEEGLPGLQAALMAALTRYLGAVGQALCVVLNIIRQTSIAVTLHNPNQAVVLNGFSAGTAAGTPPLRDVIADLGNSAPLVCQRMFRLCLPSNIQQHLSQLNLPLQIVTNYADQPWELMHDGQDFLCLKLSVGRFPAVQREPAVRPHPRSPMPNILLIGNPTGDLPAAAAEIAEIEKQFKGRAQCTHLVGPNATMAAFFNHLIQTEKVFDIIHYAGHAEFDVDRPRESVLKLWDGAVRADEIERTLSYRPLVFLNACASALGQSGELPGGYLGSYTEGLATSFLMGGARACVGPLWPVSDEAAKSFALAFYEQALQGLPLGEAVRRARFQSRQRAPGDNVWAAYLLYGDPTGHI